MSRLARPGQALVEFALVVTLLAFLVVGGVDLARAFYLDIAASSAAMVAASTAATGAPDADVRAAAQRSVGSVLPTPGVTITPAESNRVAGICTPSTCVWATVTTRYTFTPFTPLLGNLVGNSINITRTVSQRMRTSCQGSTGAAC